MTISVRLSEKLEESLRKDAKLEGKNISEIVNQALEKYQNEYKYFDSINAHHLDPLLLDAFFSLVDTDEKADLISKAGAVMIDKFYTYFSEGNNSFEQKLKLVIKFVSQNGVKFQQSKNELGITLSAVHQHDEIFSELLIRLFKKLFIKSSIIDTVEKKKGSFSIIIKNN